MIPYLALGTFLLFQGWVTWRIWRDEFFIHSEKVAQTKLVWLVPMLGAVLVFSMLSDEANHHK